ncbi:PLP-dependent aminotransferase family protein [Sinorhizobium sp. B11]
MTAVRRREGPSAAFRPDIDPSSSAPLPRQLYLALRNAVAEGRLSGGQRLPSTRLAATEWAVSRGVIAEAYEILIAEGFAVARHGSGTYIASSIPEGAARIDPPGAGSSQPIRRGVSAAATAILTRGPSLEPQKALPFVTGRIAHDERTARLLNRIATRHMNYAFEGYGDIQGEYSLRAAISAHLAVSRGVRCSPEQIFITAGTQQALDLAFRVLMTPGDRAVVEDPCYPPARQCLALNGIEVTGLPVDGDGIDIARLLDGTIAPPAAFYVTPSNQYPVGSVLSLSRRLGLLSYAEENDCWIIEDDYDSEFRYQGHPIASLHGLDKASRVLYTGTFSKALLPSLRIGYLVVPADLVPAFRAVRPAVDRCPPSFQQRVIADFLEEGYFPAHLRRLRERLRASRDMLAGFLRERLADHATVLLPDQGINLTVRSTGSWDDDTAVSAAVLKKGVVVMPLSRMNVVSKDRSRLLLGFSGLSEAEADMGTRVLAEVFEDGTFLAGG